MKNLSQLRVCFLAGTLGQGGAERQLFYMLQCLHELGAVTRVLCLEQREFWETRIRDLGVSVIYIGERKTKLARLHRVVSELRRDPAMILQSQHFYLNAYAAMAARLLGIISIGALRSNGIKEMSACGLFGGWINLRAPHVLAANSSASLLVAQGKLARCRLFKLANVVDGSLFRPAAARAPGPVRLLSVGRLIPSKRFDRFISLVAGLRQELDCDLTGIIVGSGPQLDSLRSLSAVLGLPASAIEFRGAVADMDPVYREADVFVMTSEFEGTPNVLLEAMACGLPVVSTNVGGVPEIIHSGQNGFLVNQEDAEELHRVLIPLVQNAELRAAVGRRGRAYVEANHSLARLPEMLSGLYEMALGCRKWGRTRSLTPAPAH